MPTPAPAGSAPSQGTWQAALAAALRNGNPNNWSAPTPMGVGGNPWRAPVPQMSAPTPPQAAGRPVGPQQYTGPGRYVPPAPPPPPPPQPYEDPNITGGA